MNSCDSQKTEVSDRVAYRKNLGEAAVADWASGVTVIVMIKN